MRLLIALVVWIGAVAGAVEVSTSVARSIHNPPASSSASAGGDASAGGNASGGNVTVSGGSSFDASTVKATDPRSLLRAANLTRALALARAHLGVRARLDSFALYPGYLALTVVKGSGELDVYIPANDVYSQDNTGGSAGGQPLFSLARVKANVPAALAQRIATTGHVPESQLNYMVAEIDPADNQFRWLVYPRQGSRVEYFQASGATGSLLEYLSNSSTGLQPVGG